ILFDSWQSQSGRLLLGKRADGKLACTIGGAGISICRQAGKTHLIAGTVFGLCVNMPGLLVIWSAHHAKTHGETFLAMQEFAERQRVAPYIDQVFTGSGDEEIRFHNGSRILFGARERGFGRGIPGVDVIISDEAQIMSERAVDAQLATVNTSSFGLVIWMGTPPRPEDPSEAFTNMRTKAWDGTLEDAVWIEFGAEPGSNPNDRSVWPKMNPSHPHRTPVESILRLQRKLTPESFLREAMGIWPKGVGDSAVIPSTVWDPMNKPGTKLTGPIALAVDRAPNGVDWAVAAAQRTTDGRTHLEVGFFQPGTHDEIVSYLNAVIAAWDPVALVIDRRSAAAVLEPKLVAARVEPLMSGAPQMALACQGFYDDAVAGLLSHVGDTVLDGALATAKRRKLPQGDWAWDRGGDTVVSPLVAVTLARWALLEHGRETRGPVGPPAYDATKDASPTELDVLEAAF
ncbi:MAG: terminase, partial [Gordonia polyisoprenivorans]|nr:terminase [Gordonia polyisoprenivorans]